MSSWEKGHSTPDALTMHRVAERLGVTVDYIITGNPQTRGDELAIRAVRVLEKETDVARMRVEELREWRKRTGGALAQVGEVTVEDLRRRAGAEHRAGPPDPADE